MSNAAGDALVSVETGLFRRDGSVRGLSWARTPQSGRRRGGIGIGVRNAAGAWLRTQLSIERRDFSGVFMEAARRVAAHGGLDFDEAALRPRLRTAANLFLLQNELCTARVCYRQVLPNDDSRDPQAEALRPYSRQN